MNTKSLRTTAALLIVVALGLLGAAQETEMPIAVDLAWTVTGGVQLFFPAMNELNQQIDWFNQDIVDIRSSLVSLYGESMTLDGWVSPVTASRGQFARLLYRVSPFLGVGFEAEYLALSHHGWYEIYSPDKNVAFNVKLSVPAGGALGVLCFNSADIIDLGTMVVPDHGRDRLLQRNSEDGDADPTNGDRPVHPERRSVRHRRHVGVGIQTVRHYRPPIRGRAGTRVFRSVAEPQVRTARGQLQRPD